MAPSVWMRAGAVLLLVSAASAGSAQDSRTFTGVIIDDMCAVGGHAAMRMGPTDAECARACAEEHGSPLVLLDGEHVYTLSDQKQALAHAGTRVKVVGVLDAATNTIRATSITPE